MFIKEFKIDNYGPVQFNDPVKLSGFNLFFGNNEAGKSLTIDAFVKMLFGNKASRKNFERIDRVENRPFGYLVVNIKGMDRQLPAEGDLLKLSGMDIGLELFKNIFIVRSSALDFPDGYEFFRMVTEKLTGMKREVMDKLKRGIRDIAQITESGTDFRDTKDLKLKTRVRNARTLIDELKEFSSLLKEEDFDSIALRGSSLKEGIAETEKKLKDMEDAAKRLKYLKARDSLERYRSAVERFKNYRFFTEEIREEWRDLENERDRLSDESARVRDKLESYKNERRAVKGKLDKKLSEGKIRDIKYQRVIELKQEIKRIAGSVGILNTKGSRWRFAFLGLGFLLSVPLIFGFLYSLSGWFSIVLSLIMGLSGLSIFGSLIYDFFKRRRAVKNINNIKVSLSEIPIKVKSIKIEDMLGGIADYENEYFSFKESLGKLESELVILDKNIEELDKYGFEIFEKIREINNRIGELKKKYGVNSYEEYRLKLEEKSNLLSTIEQEKTLLKNILGDVDNSGEVIKFWEKELNKLKVYENAGEGIDYSEEVYDHLREELETMREEYEKILKRFREREREFENFEKRIGEILVDEKVRCARLSDLQVAIRKLENFIKTVEERKRIALISIDILNEIERRKTREISQIFGEGSRVSEVFRKITNGRYVDVDFEEDSGVIRVISNNGMSLNEDKLSAGTFDQLFFSIRVAFAEKLLDDKGFFVLDDPFIRSDLDRLRRQLDTLLEISNLGWQILYFSAKGEVKDYLDGKVEIIELD